MSKFIDADRLRAKIERRIDKLNPKTGMFGGRPMREVNPKTFPRENELEKVLDLIDSLQQEQPIKVYRVENEKEQKGLWRKFDGTWKPLFDMLTDGQCKDMPMDDSPIYREGGKQWFASAPSKETLQKWFSKRDLEELTAKGFTISEFEVVGHKKISDFEYIFTRDNIINRTYLKVSDIYPQEQPDDVCSVIKEYYGKKLPFEDERTKAAYHFFSPGCSFELRKIEEERVKHITDLLDNYQKGKKAGYKEAISELKEGKIECSPVMKELIDKLFGIGNAYNFGFGPKDFLQEQAESSNGKFVFPNFLYARTIDNKTIDVSYAPQSMDAVEYVKNDPTEQLDVDLKEEIDRMWNPRFILGWDDNSLLSINHKSFEAIARHFYELGLKRKEENK